MDEYRDLSGKLRMVKDASRGRQSLKLTPVAKTRKEPLRGEKKPPQSRASGRSQMSFSVIKRPFGRATFSGRRERQRVEG